jgi:hypothetical protein
MHFFFQVPQDLAGSAATPHVWPHKHALDLSAPLVDWPEPTAPDGLVPLPCDDEISTGLLKFSFIDTADHRARIQCGDLRIQLLHQRTGLFILWAYCENHAG